MMKIDNKRTPKKSKTRIMRTTPLKINSRRTRKPKSVKKSGMYFQNFEFEILEFWVHPMQNRG